MKGFLVLFVLSIFSCSCNEKIKNVDYFPCYSKNNKETREHSNDISLEIDNNSICDNEFFLFGNPYEIFIKHMRSRTYTKIQFYNNGALKEKTIIYWDSSLCKMLTTGFKYFYDLRGNLDGLEYWENDTALYGVFYNSDRTIDTLSGSFSNPFVSIEGVNKGLLKYGYNDTLKIVAITPPNLSSVLNIYVVNNEKIAFESDSLISRNQTYKYYFNSTKFQREYLRSLYFQLVVKNWNKGKNRYFSGAVFIK